MTGQKRNGGDMAKAKKTDKRVRMENRGMPGAVAHPKESEVPTWEAKGWKVCPARGLAPAESRASENSAMKGQEND